MSRLGRISVTTVLVGLAVGLAPVPQVATAASTPGHVLTAAGTIPAAQPPARVLAEIPVTTTQVIEVTATRWRTSYARLRTWQRQPDGTWAQVASAKARVGARGLAPAQTRRQSTLTTPTGTFALGQAFGRGVAPEGTRMPYRVLTRADYWVYDPRDPATYNRWIVGRTGTDQWRTSWAEHLVSYTREYRYAVVIDFNHAASAGSPSTRSGGGIFLHVNGPGATAGCVSVSRAKMAGLLAWLDPAADPRIVISVAGATAG